MDRPMDNLTNELVGDVGSPESGEGKKESGEGEEQAFRNLCSHYSRGCSLVVSITNLLIGTLTYLVPVGPWGAWSNSIWSLDPSHKVSVYMKGWRTTLG